MRDARAGGRGIGPLRSGRLGRAGLIGLIAGLSLGLASGCETTQQKLWQTGLPWTQAPFEVAEITPRGPYLDVSLVDGDEPRRVLTLDNEPCRSVFEVGVEVTLTQEGSTGTAERNGVACDLVGIGNLDEWRLSRAVGLYGEGPIVRSTTRIAIVARDADYLYAVGGFGISGRFQWSPGTDHVVALLPRSGPCVGMEEGYVSVLYQETGEPALSISAPDGPCPISAVAAYVPDAFGPLPEGLAPGGWDPADERPDEP